MMPHLLFAEHEHYFSQPYLPGKTSSMEDKDFFVREQLHFR